MTDNNDLIAEIEEMYEDYKGHSNYTVDALIDNILQHVEADQQQYEKGKREERNRIKQAVIEWWDSPKKFGWGPVLGSLLSLIEGQNNAGRASK